MTSVVNEVEIDRAPADPYIATSNRIEAPVAGNEAAADGDGVSRRSGEFREVAVPIMEIGEADLYRSDGLGVLKAAMGGGTVSAAVAPATDFSFIDLEETRYVEEYSQSDVVRIPHRAVGNWMNGFELGDMVWGKVKSHPWWPGHIFSEEFASPSVRRTRREGHVLVAFFGDSSYGWFDPAELIPFDTNYDEKSKQTILRPFVKAVEEAADETSRREALALTCYCRNKFNFRPARVSGFLHVDVPGFEPGGIYSKKQIDSARNKFMPEKTLLFVQEAAANPISDAVAGVDLIKNVAMVLAYRRAVFEEFDETYAQAFGVEPVRPSPHSGPMPEHTERFASRAPLSGPLVMPEPLRPKKSSSNKLGAPKVGRPPSAKKNKYVLKRRDEQENTGGSVDGSVDPPKPSLPDFPSAAQPYRNYTNFFPLQQQMPSLVFQDASSPGSSIVGDYVLQKRPPPPAATIDEKPPAPQEFFDRQFSEQKPVPMSVDINVALPTQSPQLTVIELRKLDPAAAGQTSDAKDVAVLARHEEGWKSKDAKAASEIPKQKKRKIRPREDGSSSAPDGTGEVKKKKKRKKVQISEVGQLPDHLKVFKIEDLNKKPTEKSISIGPELVKRGDGVPGTAKPSVVTVQLPNIDLSSRNLLLPELVGDLQQLALDPFYGLDRDVPWVALHVFLKFRSLVYQKSLALSLASEADALEVQDGKYSAARPVPEDVAVSVQTAPAKVTKEERESLKPPRAGFRSDDPTVAGRKRTVSDRQEEMSVKRQKKLEKLKALPAEKKAAINQIGPDAQQRDQKEAGGASASATVVPGGPAKPSNKASETVRKQEALPAEKRSPSPTTLVMKFPPRTTLPSIASLKARFARFGPLELSGTRVFWKSNTCKVVFKFKPDAEAALNYGRANEMFGQVKVQYFLRDADSAADPSAETSGQRLESRPTEGVQFRAGSVASGSGGVSFGQPRPLFTPNQKPAVQLKSILKKPGDDAGSSIGAGGRDVPRVKFMLDGVNDKVPAPPPATVSGSNNSRNNTDAPPSSSFPPVEPVLGKPSNPVSFLPPPQPLSLPRPLPSRHSRMMDNPYYQPLIIPPPPTLNRAADRVLQPPPFSRNDDTESYVPVSARSGDSQPHSPMQPSEAEGRGMVNKEFASQMLNLLVRCSDIVTNVKSSIGYVPYHPL